MSDTASQPIEVDSIIDLAVSLSRVSDTAAASQNISKAARKLTRVVVVIEWIRWLAIVLGLIATLIGALKWLQLPPGMITGSLAPMTVVVIGCSAVVLGGFSQRLIQTRQSFRVSRPFDVLLPQGAEQVLRDLAAGRRRAVTLKSYGSGATGSQRGPGGTLVDREFAAGTFENRFAPLLYSASPKVWPYVWMPFGHRVTSQIFVVRESSIDGDSELPLANFHPDDQWLVGRSLTQFDANLEIFLKAEIAPNQMAWYRLVLQVGRRELRRGRQRGAQAQAISEIKARLVDGFKADSGPQGGDSAHLIKQLLQGKRGKSDIKRYFRDPAS